MLTSVKTFISYAHTDQEWQKKLEDHLSSLKYSGKITIWQDQEIPAGANWEDQINTHLNEADMILLLISASFIASKYCWDKVVQTALERHRSGTARVIPIILKPALWQDTPLGELQALPTEAKPITLWNDEDAALEDVVQGIRDIVTVLQHSPGPPMWLRWLIIGMRHINAGCYIEALDACRHGLRLSSNNISLLQVKGMVLTMLNRYKEALNAYDQAICLHPTSAMYQMKGMVLARLNRYKEALDACEQAIRLNPRATYQWKNLILDRLKKRKKGRFIRNRPTVSPQEWHVFKEKTSS